MEKNMKGKRLTAIREEFEKEKMELIKLRIQNGFYNRNEVLETVVSSIIKSGIRNSDGYGN
jgi:hypothetical protein